MEYIGLVPNMFLWWYSQGIKEVLDFCWAILVFLKNTFSVPLNLKTLFAPWRRTAKPLEPSLVGLKNFILDQIVARGFGLVVRLFSLIAYLLLTLIVMPVLLMILIIWVILPVMGATFLIAWIKHLW